jgi:transposase
VVVGLVVGKRQSRPWIVSDELWSLIEPLLPKPGPKLVEGRPRVPDRQALCGILFVLHTGIQWEYLPQELGFGSGMTCWRRLAAWNEAGVWEKLHVVLLRKLRAAKKLDWSRAVIDSSHVRAARRGPKAGPARSTAHGRAASTTSSPTDRASRSQSR